MTNWEKYFGSTERVIETLDAICNSETTDCRACPFYVNGCIFDEWYLESEANNE